MTVSPNVQKNTEKKYIECKVEFDHETNVYKTNDDDTGFKIETVDNFPLPFNEFYDISQDSFENHKIWSINMLSIFH